MPIVSLALAVTLLAPLSAAASEPASTDAWTRFRGSAGTSVVAERRYPAEWGPGKNVAWSVEIDGSGWSSPIVAGDRVFVSAAVDPGEAEPKSMSEGVRDPSTMGRGAKPTEEMRFELSCRALADGELLWKREVGRGVPKFPVHASNTYATETPATDGERVFVTFGALGVLACYDLDGVEKWRVDTGVFKTGNDFGWGISLLTHGGLVFLQNDNEEASFLAAFDAVNGEQRWRAERGAGTSWGTPVVWETKGRASIVACGRDTVIAYDLATGTEHWRVQGIGGSFSSSPSFDDERLYFGNSGPRRRGPLVAVPAAAEGTLDLKASSPPPIAWRVDRAGPGFASPLAHDGLLYVIGSSNVMACYDAATGERLWRERVPGNGTVVASPWVTGNELHVLDESGTTVVLKTGRTFEVLRTNAMEGLYWGTPSVAGDALLLREAQRLHCIRADRPGEGPKE